MANNQSKTLINYIGLHFIRHINNRHKVDYKKTHFGFIAAVSQPKFIAYQGLLVGE